MFKRAIKPFKGHFITMLSDLCNKTKLFIVMDLQACKTRFFMYIMVATVTVLPLPLAFAVPSLRETGYYFNLNITFAWYIL